MNEPMNNAPSAATMTPGRAGAAHAWLSASPAQRLRALIGAVAGFALALALTSAGADMLNDADTLWHIAVGRDIWLSKSFPHVDLYSHSFAGEPWIAKEWLSQILLYGAYAAGGWNGVVVLTIAVMLAVFGQLYFALSSRIKPIVAAGLAVAAVGICSTVVLARPHILVLPFVFLFVWQSWRAAEEGRAPSFWLLAAMCLWSNMHASFTFGFVAAGLAFLHYLFEHRQFRSGQTYRWIAFLALCPVASIIHPYGVEAIWSTISIAQSQALPYVLEWRAFSMSKDIVPGLIILGSIGAALASGLRVRLVAAAFICLLLYMYFTHMRFLYLLFILSPALLVKDVAARFPAIGVERWRGEISQSEFERALVKYAPPAIAVCAAALGVLLIAALSVAKWAPERTYPIAAINAARAAALSGNVMNFYNFGGALIFEGVPTFVDGRADRLYQQGFIPDIDKARRGDRDIFERQLERYDIAWTMLPPADKRVAMLDETPGWTRIYEDERAVVHARREAGKR